MAGARDSERQTGIEGVVNRLTSGWLASGVLPRSHSRGAPLIGPGAEFLSSSYGHVVGYLIAIVGAFVVGEAMGLVASEVYVANATPVYLLLVLLVAVVFGKGPAVVAAISSVLALSWLFAEPVRSLRIDDAGEWVLVLTFLATGLVSGQLTAILRQNAHEARLREREAVILAEMMAHLAEHDLPTMARALAKRLKVELRLAAVVLAVEGCGEEIKDAVTGGEEALAYAAGADSDEHLEEARTTVVTAASDILVRALSPITLPWRSDNPVRRQWYRRRVGVNVDGQLAGTITVVRAGVAGPFSPADGRLLATVAALLGQSCERERLRREATETEILRRAGNVKTALLHAVSHDLRSPLASITAAAANLLEDDLAWTDEERDVLARSIHAEAGRLSQLIEGLLDLSRLEAGMIEPLKEWYDLELMLDDVLGRLGPVTAGHRVVTAVAEDLPPVPLDYVKIGQVVANLVENAAKYAPAGSEITVSAEAVNGEARVSVADSGPGLPEHDPARLFEPFFRGDRGGGQVKGDGLGLAVAKGLVEAHGGRIWAENRPEGGARFVVALPLYGPAMAESAGVRVDE